jgi:hypothetical protein
MNRIDFENPVLRLTLRSENRLDGFEDMPSADAVGAFFDGLKLNKVNTLTEYLRQLVLQYDQLDRLGNMFLLKARQNADTAVGAEILVQYRAEQSEGANMMLTTKSIYLVFWYSYMTIHIFTAFSN